MCGSAPEWVWLFFRTGVAKRADKCGSVTGIYTLHQRFFQEPECADVRREIEELRQELREQLDRQNREKLLKLVDLGIELREETSLAGFMAGFKLAWGLAQELEADGLYSFEDEEEARACRRAEEV